MHYTIFFPDKTDFINLCKIHKTFLSLFAPKLFLFHAEILYRDISLQRRMLLWI